MTNLDNTSFFVESPEYHPSANENTPWENDIWAAIRLFKQFRREILDLDQSKFDRSRRKWRRQWLKDNLATIQFLWQEVSGSGETRGF